MSQKSIRYSFRRRGRPPASRSPAPPRRWPRVLAVPAATAVVVIGGTPLLVGQAAAAPTAPTTPVLAGLDGKAHITVAVLGDSFTSGEGASSHTYRTREVFVGDQRVQQVDPAHQSGAAPALQAIDSLRPANPDLLIDARLAAVSGATTAQLAARTGAGTPFEHPSQLSQAAGARVVVLGLGADDMGFAAWFRTVVTQRPEVSAVAYNRFLTKVLDPAFGKQLVGTYRTLLGTMAPGGRLIVTGFPKVVPDEIPAVTGNAIDTGVTTAEAQLSNQLTDLLNGVIRKAVSQVGIANKNVTFVDNTDAFEGHLLLAFSPAINPYSPVDDRGSFHPNAAGQKLLAARLTPALKQALDQIEVTLEPAQQDAVLLPPSRLATGPTTGRPGSRTAGTPATGGQPAPATGQQPGSQDGTNQPAPPPTGTQGQGAQQPATEPPPPPSVDEEPPADTPDDPPADAGQPPSGQTPAGETPAGEAPAGEAPSGQTGAQSGSDGVPTVDGQADPLGQTDEDAAPADGVPTVDGQADPLGQTDEDAAPADGVPTVDGQADPLGQTDEDAAPADDEDSAAPADDSDASDDGATDSVSDVSDDSAGTDADDSSSADGSTASGTDASDSDSSDSDASDSDSSGSGASGSDASSSDGGDGGDGGGDGGDGGGGDGGGGDGGD